MSDKPDFEKLKRERDEALEQIVQGVADKWGVDRKEIVFHMCPPGCYCACPEGPCEHEFSGWRAIEDEDGSERGGETFCQKCGMGCMAHDMRVAP